MSQQPDDDLEPEVDLEPDEDFEDEEHDEDTNPEGLPEFDAGDDYPEEEA